MKHLHVFNTIEEMHANANSMTPPWAAVVRNTNSCSISTMETTNALLNMQAKTVTINETGVTTILPDAGYGSMSRVDVDVNVSSGGNAPERPTYTGHADAEGLRAIGWTDEDIEYYQANGVNWNEEEDEYHKVTDDNKALYGVLTANNISTYKDRIVYLPKIDTSNVTTMNGMFSGCYALVSIPQLDTSNVTNMGSMFSSCYALVSIPQLDTSNVTNMTYMFSNCRSLVSIPQLDTAKVTSMNGMFNNCTSLTNVKLKNVKLAYQLNYSALLSKESLLYIINNSIATSAVTIKLKAYAYTRLANDPDIVAALANHPNISIAQ